MDSNPLLDALAERFCVTPIPDSVCADPCATRKGPGRTGTNLLTVSEAREVLGAVLADTLTRVALLEERARTVVERHDAGSLSQFSGDSGSINDLRELLNQTAPGDSDA